MTSCENGKSRDVLRQAPGNQMKAWILAGVLRLKSVPVREIEEGDAGAIPRTASSDAQTDRTFVIPVVTHVFLLEQLGP